MHDGAGPLTHPWERFFSDLGTVVGSGGKTGDPGPRGFTGLQGLQGGPGPKGDQGNPGVQGNTGIQGLDGVTGVTGLIGDAGNTGIQGLDGQTGVQGGTGVQGVTGLGNGATIHGSAGTSELNGVAIFTDQTTITEAQTNSNASLVWTNPNWTTSSDSSWTFGNLTGGSPALLQVSVSGLVSRAGAGLTGVQGSTGLQGSGLQGQTGIQGITGLITGVDSGSSLINGVAIFPTTTSVTQALTGSTPAMTWTGLNFVVAADSTFVSPRVNTPSIQAATALSVTGPTTAQFYCGDVNHVAYGSGIFTDTSSVSMRSGVIFSPTYSLVLDHDQALLRTNVLTTILGVATTGILALGGLQSVSVSGDANVTPTSSRMHLSGAAGTITLDIGTLAAGSLLFVTGETPTAIGNGIHSYNLSLDNGATLILEGGVWQFISHP